MITADLHIHTSKSYDSLQSPQVVASYAEQAGVDVIAITDHDEFGAHEAVRASSDDLCVVPGMEVRTEDYDDLLALFIDRPIRSSTFGEAVEEIHRQGGLAVLPHPYRKISEFPDWNSVDAIEGLNGRSKRKNNEAAQELTSRHDLPVVGGSDAHTPWEIGNTRTVVDLDGAPTPMKVKRAIQDGKTSVDGGESPYYLYHGLSFSMEMYKSIRGKLNTW